MKIHEREDFLAELTRQIKETAFCSQSDVALGKDLLALTARTIADMAQTSIEEVGFVLCDERLWCYDPLSGVWGHLPFSYVKGWAQEIDGSPTVDRNGEPTTISISNNKARGIMECVRADAHLRNDNFFESAPAGMGFTNGFLTIRSGVLMFDKHKASNRLRHAFSFAYDAEQEITHWIEFLSSLFECDIDKGAKISTIQEFMGACLMGNATQYQQCLVLFGAGANGKSVLCDAIEQVFDRSQIATCTPNKWSQEYYAASLRDVNINIVSESPTSYGESDIFKAVISGDRIAGRQPYEQVATFHPRAGHVFSCNELPSSGDNTVGFWRRFLVLTFNKDFTKSSKRKTKEEILKALGGERVGIIEWAMRGYRRLVQQGTYTTPLSHGAAMNNWKVTNDGVQDFIVNCCEAGGGERLSDLGDIYRTWASKTGRKPLSDRRLSNRLRAAGVAVKRQSTGMVFLLSAKAQSDWSDFEDVAAALAANNNGASAGGI
jgi:P4 family phage/plasmid primase-like protien